MKLNPEFKEEYLTRWPERYYDLSPEERLCALSEVLKRNPDSAEDQRRLEIHRMRYDDKGKDRFLNAWMMLKSTEAQPHGFFMKNKFIKDVTRELSRLGIAQEEPDELLKAEWRDFADTMIKMYLNSPSYRSAVFGMGSVNDRNVSFRLATEVETVTKTVPALALAEESVLPFRAILLERFTVLVPNGGAILREVQSR